MDSDDSSEHASILPGKDTEEPKVVGVGGQFQAIRRATVYDAVAGRISTSGFISRGVQISSTRDTASSSMTAVAPEDVLFRRKNAPTRYAEFDIYFANERGLNGELPPSDLLKALHSYVSDFYSRATLDEGVTDWRSMDETALMAFGVLMEELVREILGDSGDLVFTEGRRETSESEGDTNTRPASTKSSRKPSVGSTHSASISEARKKRRRLDPAPGSP